MRCVIVPNILREAIDAALDKAFAGLDPSSDDRAACYQQLLDYYDEHGRLPDFTIERQP